MQRDVAYDIVAYAAKAKFSDLPESTVRMELRNGRVVSRRVEILKGNPANPTTEEEDIEKFNECVRFGVKEMSDEGRNKLAQLILNLEKLDDIREIVEHVT